MDEHEIERGFANFHRTLNRILRKRDVRAFKAHIAAHPAQAVRLSHCLGLSDELAEVEMYKAIAARAPLRDLHGEAVQWLKARGVQPPAPKKPRRGWKRGREKRGKTP